MTIEKELLDVVRPETVGFSRERLSRIDDALRRQMEDGQLAGAVCVIARDGQVAYFSASGYANRESQLPMTRDAIFRIASMTKPITCVALLQLFEQGHFLLDDPVCRFLPEFASTKVYVRQTETGMELAELEQPITIRDLFMHTSGLATPGAQASAHPVARLYAAEGIRRYDESLADMIPRLAKLPLVHQPSAGWTYGMSHDVIGRLIEVISGMQFDAYLREYVFEPLGMPDTGFYTRREDLQRLVPVYTSDGQGNLQLASRAELTRTELPAYLNGGGGLVSTAADYARFCQMMLDGGAGRAGHLLSRKTIELMTANHWTGPSSPFPPGFPIPDGYGFGLGVRTLVDPARSGLPGSAGEYGWAGAYTTYFWIDPRERMIGLFLTQVEPPNLRLALKFHVLAYQALDD